MTLCVCLCLSYRQYTSDYKLETYLKVARLYLEDEDPVQAEAYINRAALLQAESTREDLQIHYKASSTLCVSVDVCVQFACVYSTPVFCYVLSAFTMFSDISKDVQSVKFLWFKLLFSLHFTSQWLLTVMCSGVNVFAAQVCNTTAAVCNVLRCECARCSGVQYNGCCL